MENHIDIIQESITIRHHLHAHPERTWNEIETSKFVANALRQINGIDVQVGVGKLGVVGILKGKNPGPVIALRADMDALPILEESDLPYKSKTIGTMHACGHDGHTAILLGAAKILATKVSQINGTIKFIFQPAEEGGAGANAMCLDGVLENPNVEQIFGLHGMPTLELGKIGVRNGTMMAGTAEIHIEISGKGGHAAMPHLAIDPIIIGSQVVLALQTISSRLVAPTEPVVLSITQFHAGTANNVIPQKIDLKGTLRTTSKETQQKCIHHIKTIVENIAHSFSATAIVKITPAYPPTVNEIQATNFLRTIANQVIGSENLVELREPLMGAEDFAFYLQRIPGCFFFLGLDDRNGEYPSLHHPKFDFNDKAISVGIEMMAQIALTRLT